MPVPEERGTRKGGKRKRKGKNYYQREGPRVKEKRVGDKRVKGKGERGRVWK
jgi:hypothetical protein